MSSFISIGFVFDKHQSITVLFSKFIEFLIARGVLNKISYSIDENGDNWNEKIIKGYSSYEVTSLMVNNYFGKANITAAILDDKKINFDISISKLQQEDFGFLIEIDIDQLFKVGNREELKNCSSMIITFCETLFNKMDFCYAFCDHEVGIEYTWNEFSQLDKCIYSISIIPQNEKFVIDLASWEIDGLTSRSRKS